MAKRNSEFLSTKKLYRTGTRPRCLIYRFLYKRPFFPWPALPPHPTERAFIGQFSNLWRLYTYKISPANLNPLARSRHVSTIVRVPIASESFVFTGLYVFQTYDSTQKPSERDICYLIDRPRDSWRKIFAFFQFNTETIFARFPSVFY